MTILRTKLFPYISSHALREFSEDERRKRVMQDASGQCLDNCYDFLELTPTSSRFLRRCDQTQLALYFT